MNLGRSGYDNISQGPSPTSFPPSTPEVPVTEEKESVIGIDIRTYEGEDTTSVFDFTRLQFTHQNDYIAAAQNPVLPEPDPEGESGPQPYGIYQQKLIIKFFSDRVRNLLKDRGLSSEESKSLYNHLMTGAPLTNPKLLGLAKSINEQVTAETKQQAHLSDSWTIKSTSKTDWTPLPILPYSEEKQSEINQFYDTQIQQILAVYIQEAQPPLTSEQINLLKLSLSKGKASFEIAEAYAAITGKASQATQQAFGLNEVWFRGTDNPDNWKPINSGIVTPAAVSDEVKIKLLENMIKFLTAVQTIGENILGKLPPNDPNRISLKEFLSAIAAAISELKDELRKMQTKDIEKADKLGVAKFQQIDDRRARAEEAQRKAAEAAKKSKGKETLGKVMKIVGPIIAVVSVIVGAGLSLFGGVGIPLILAGIAVGAAITTYSIVDSFAGITSKIVGAFNDFLKDLMPDQPEWARTLVKIAFVVAVVAVLAVVVVAGTFMGGAGASVAAQVIGQGAKQIAVQGIMMTVVSSNAIPEMLANTLTALGVDKDKSQIAQAIMMATQVVIVMAAMAIASKGISPSGIAKGVTETVKEAGKSVLASTQRLIQFVKTLPDTLKDSLSNINKLATYLLVYLDNLAKSTKNLPAAALQEVKNIINGYKGLYSPDAKLMGIARIVNAVMELIPPIINVADGISRCVMLLKVEELLRQVGELKAAEELLQELIKMLDKVMQKIQSGMESQGEFIAALQRDLVNIFDSARQSVAKMIQASAI